MRILIFLLLGLLALGMLYHAARLLWRDAHPDGDATSGTVSTLDRWAGRIILYGLLALFGVLVLERVLLPPPPPDALQAPPSPPKPPASAPARTSPIQGRFY